MNEQLRLIIDLQAHDTKILALNKTLKAIPAKIRNLDQPLKSAEDKLAASRERLKELEETRRERQREAAETKDRINKLKSRTGEIKDNKAYTAHLKEIENIEKSIAAQDDKVLASTSAMEKLQPEIKAAEAALAAEKAKAEDYKKSLEAEVLAANKELDRMKAERTELTRKVSREVYEMYMSLMSKLGGVAVAEVANEICTGCDMNIMPQLFVEIKRGQRLMHCPQCKRIVFYRGTEDAGVVAITPPGANLPDEE